MSKVFAFQCDSKKRFPFNVGGLLIKQFSKTDFSHYALGLVDDSASIKFFDSSSHGVRENKSRYFSRKYRLVKGLEIDTISENEFMEFFNEHRGKKYGFKQVIGLAGKIFHIFKNNPFGSGAKRIICNELVILYTNHRGLTDIKDTDSLDLNDTTDLLKGLK